MLSELESFVGQKFAGCFEIFGSNFGTLFWSFRYLFGWMKFDHFEREKIKRCLCNIKGITFIVLVLTVLNVCKLFSFLFLLTYGFFILNIHIYFSAYWFFFRFSLWNNEPCFKKTNVRTFLQPRKHVVLIHSFFLYNIIILQGSGRNATLFLYLSSLETMFAYKRSNWSSSWHQQYKLTIELLSFFFFFFPWFQVWNTIVRI